MPIVRVGNRRLCHGKSGEDPPPRTLSWELRLTGTPLRTPTGFLCPSAGVASLSLAALVTSAGCRER